MASSSNIALGGCVQSLQSSLHLLDSSIAILDGGVADFPRLGKVLSTTRHFELLPEATIQTAQSSLLATLTPEVTALLDRVAAHLDKLERRRDGLVAKAELQEGRLNTHSHSHSHTRGPSVGGSRAGKIGAGAGGAQQEEKAMRLGVLRRKKERLGYAVERLGLQAQQRERQLRMSMNFAGA